MPIDVAAARADTPATKHLAHLNNAGASLSPTPVLEAVVDHLRLEAEIGGYEAADLAGNQIEHTYDAIAELIGAGRSEIALVENATRAWDMAFYSFRFEPGDRILCARAEYASNVIALLQMARHTGVEIITVPNDESGQLSVDALAELLDDPRVKLVAITHIPTHGGLINPAAAIGALTSRAGVPFLLDACQSVGQLRVDVGEIRCDMLSATGRKFLRAPRGTGFLYVSDRLVQRLDPPLLDLRAADLTGPDAYEMRPDARRFETWESSVAGRIGLGRAVDYALALGMGDIEARVIHLAAQLRDRLRRIPAVTVHDQGERQGAIVTFSVGTVPAGHVVSQLRGAGVNTIVSGSGVRYDFDHLDVPDVVRASVHYFNDDDDLDRLVSGVESLLAGAELSPLSGSQR